MAKRRIQTRVLIRSCVWERIPKTTFVGGDIIIKMRVINSFLTNNDVNTHKVKLLKKFVAKLIKENTIAQLKRIDEIRIMKRECVADISPEKAGKEKGVTKVYSMKRTTKMTKSMAPAFICQGR